jgi:hypothetical protein
MAQVDTPVAHVPEHGICVRCGMHLVNGRETLPCRGPSETVVYESIWHEADPVGLRKSRDE